MNEKMSLFDRAKQVSALQAAERYANVVPKGTRRVTVCCPIHNERTPSCVFYENGTFHCFGCHAGGTSIDLVMALLHLSAKDAAQRICEDFGLDPGQPIDPKVLKKQRELQGVRAVAKKAASFTHAVQCGVIRWCDDRLNELDPQDDSDAAQSTLTTLLELKQDAENLTEAISALEDARRQDDLNTLLRAVQRMSVDRYRLLNDWDRTQGTEYVKALTGALRCAERQEAGGYEPDRSESEE